MMLISRHLSVTLLAVNSVPHLSVVVQAETAKHTIRLILQTTETSQPGSQPFY